MDELRHLTAQMAREGVRRLLVLSGDDAWTLHQAQRVRTALVPATGCGSARVRCPSRTSRLLP